MAKRLLSKDTILRLLQSAEMSLHHKDFQTAIEQLERACKFDPSNTDILLDLGRVYGLRYDYAGAQRSFDMAVRLARCKVSMLSKVSLRCRDFGGLDLAEGYLRQALRQSDVVPEVLVQLSEVCERLRKVDEANDLIDRALHTKDDCMPALLQKAKLDRQAGKLDEAEKRLRELVMRTPPSMRVICWHEIGMIKDRQKLFDDAFVCFQNAKALLIPESGPYLHQLRVVREWLKSLRESFCHGVFKQWQAELKDLQPERSLTILCGHPRSGTTLLEQVLDSHPDVVSAEETSILHDDAFVPLTRKHPYGTPMFTVLESASVNDLRNSRDLYFKTMDRFLRKAVEGRMLIDKNPSLTFLLPIIVRIFPEAKLLLAMRDPRDVCISCFMQLMPLNQSSAAYLTIEGTINDYVELMTMWRTVESVLEISSLTVKYEEMVNNLEATARNVSTFLGLDWNSCVLRFNEHASQKLVRSPTYADVTKPIFSSAIGRWRNYRRFLEPFVDRLDPFVEAFGYT